MVDIVKASGEKEKFEKDKFCSSLERAGATQNVVARVCAKVSHDLTEGMNTEELFRHAFSYLKEEDMPSAVRYSLKRGIFALGPAGFNFEHYVERIMNIHGYVTKRNVFMKGVCVEHEIDIVAEKGDEHFIVEVKYHNEQGTKTDVTVAMYTDARLSDIAPAEEEKERGWKARHRAWLVTNTKFTSSAIQYGKCRNIKMIGWRYPHGEGLEDFITAKKIYPVTILPSVGRGELEALARKNVILVQDLVSYTPEYISREFGIPEKRAGALIAEAYVCLTEKHDKNHE
ncbi:MAG: restriction endonuclease [Patescibacteria group bacterium]